MIEDFTRIERKDNTVHLNRFVEYASLKISFVLKTNTISLQVSAENVKRTSAYLIKLFLNGFLFRRDLFTDHLVFCLLYVYQRKANFSSNLITVKGMSDQKF